MFLVNGQRVKHYIGIDVECDERIIELSNELKSLDAKLCYDVKSSTTRQATYGDVFLVVMSFLIFNFFSKD